MRIESKEQFRPCKSCLENDGDLCESCHHNKKLIERLRNVDTSKLFQEAIPNIKNVLESKPVDLAESLVYYIVYHPSGRFDKMKLETVRKKYLIPLFGEDIINGLSSRRAIK